MSRRWSAAECDEVDRAEQDLLLHRLGDLADAPILDLGCGIGRLTPALRSRASAVVSLDRSSQMLLRGRDLIDCPIQADVAALPFATETFAAVVTSGVLQHVISDAVYRDALREVARVLLAGGTAVFIEGLGRDSPSTSTSPVRTRTVSEYAAALSPRLRLVEQSEFVRVEDPYMLLVWRKGDSA